MGSGRGEATERGGGADPVDAGGPRAETGGASEAERGPESDPLWRDQRAILERSPDGHAIVDAAGAVTWCNGAFARLHGFRAPAELLREIADREWWTLYPSSSRRQLRREVRAWLGGSPEAPWRGELSGAGRAGATVSRELGLVQLESGALALTVRDLTARRRRERALASRERLFRLLADHTSDLIALHEPDGLFVYVSPSARRVLGYGRRELLGRALWELAHADDARRVRRCMKAAARGEAGQTTYRARHQGGSYRWLETTAQPIRARRQVVQIQTCSRDVTERKELERALAYQALHDPLTGLPNRSLFMNRLEQARARARRLGCRFVLLFLDLDGFKEVNDSLGHLAGDELLRGIARRLETCVRESDTVARLGGDEFAVLLEGVERPEAVPPLVERVRKAFSEPLSAAGRQLRIQASIGVAVSGPEADSSREMIRRADGAMYEAKRSADPPPEAQ